MTAAKRLIYAGLVRARPELPGGRAGVLVDERYGQPVIDAAHADRVVLALPVERSGRDWFELEWGQQWLEHVTSDRPDFAKVPIRDNPAFPRGDRERQLHAPREVSDALHRIGVPLLYELLVPATDGQLAHVGGSASAYDRDLRPGLVIRVIADNQAVGSGRSKAWRRRTPRGPSWPRSGPAGATMSARSCSGAMLLPRDWTTGSRWPRRSTASWGFAIGRSIWEEPIADHIGGKVGEEETADRIAGRYLGFARQYCAAAGQGSAEGPEMGIFRRRPRPASERAHRGEKAQACGGRRMAGAVRQVPRGIGKGRDDHSRGLGLLVLPPSHDAPQRNPGGRVPGPGRPLAGPVTGRR